jgi:holin-like protein
LPLRFVERGASLLIRNLPLFFVPLAAGFIDHRQLLAAHGVAIAISLVASAAIGFAVTGRVAQFICRLQHLPISATRSIHAKTHLHHR